MNKLYDNYRVTGTDVKGFLEEIRDMSIRTTYPLVSPADMHLLSFKEKIEKKEGKETKYTYIFYVLGRTDLTNAEKSNSGFTKWFFSACTRNGETTTTIELMEEIIRVSGLMLVYKNENGEDVYNGVSGLALMTLCKKAGVPGDRVRIKSLWRDAYIAEGLLPKKPDNDDPVENAIYDRAMSEGIKLVVRHNAVYKDNKVKLQKLGMILGVFGESYNESGMKIIADIYNTIKAEKKMGKVRIASWDVSQDYTSIRMEFPEAAEKYALKYGFKEKLIPGVTILSSDCGLSSLNIAGTFRVEGSNCVTVVNEYARKHVGKFGVKDIMQNVNTMIIEKFEEFPKAMSRLRETKLSDMDLNTEVGRQRYDSRMRTAIGNAIEQLGIAKDVGKKRVEALKESMAGYIGRDEECTLYDVAEAFICLEDVIAATEGVGGIGETAHNSLSRSLSAIYKVDFFKSEKRLEKKNKKESASGKKEPKSTKNKKKENVA